MQIAIRVDANLHIGRGHLARCMTLAAHLREEGATVRFICRHDPIPRAALLTRNGFEVDWLPDLRASETNGDWPSGDAEHTCAVLAAQETLIDWLIVDHYGLADAWEQAVRPWVGRLMVIDDLANRTHDCDLLLDQTYGADAGRYAGLIPPSCRTLLGSDYALLRPEFAAERARLEDRSSLSNSARSFAVHVFFGSGDPLNHTTRYSEWLLEAFPQLIVRAAVGPEFAASEDLEELQRRFPQRFDWERGVTDMARHMAVCQVAVGAPGVATWERACLGLPAAYLAIASNQVAILRQLAAGGFCEYLGTAESCSREEFVTRIDHFLGNPARLATLRQFGMAAIDGQGVCRVARAMEGQLAC